MNIKYVVIGILFSLIVINQSVLSVTPYDDNTGFTTQTANWQAPYIDGGGSVQYSYKDVGTDMSLKIDWSTYSKTNLLLSNKVIKDQLVKKIMQDVANLQGASSNPSYVKLYFTSKCVARLKTVYLLEQSPSLDCCPEGFNVPENLIETLTFEGNTRRVIKKYAWVDCGEKCCVLSYKFNWDYFDNWVFESSSYSAASNCDPLSSYTDCLTNQPIPCNGGCSGYGE